MHRRRFAAAIFVAVLLCAAAAPAASQTRYHEIDIFRFDPYLLRVRASDSLFVEIGATDGSETAALLVDPDSLAHWTDSTAILVGLPVPTSIKDEIDYSGPTIGGSGGTMQLYRAAGGRAPSIQLRLTDRFGESSYIKLSRQAWRELALAFHEASALTDSMTKAGPYAIRMAEDGDPIINALTARSDGGEFSYPGYLNNIVRQIAVRFQPPPNTAARAEVRFLIHRDGSVSDINFVTRSGTFEFDLDAQGAVEQAGSVRAFGALPAGFPHDVLPIIASFSPGLGDGTTARVANTMINPALGTKRDSLWESAYYSFQVETQAVPLTSRPPGLSSSVIARCSDGEMLVQFVVDSTGSIVPSSEKILKAALPPGCPAESTFPSWLRNWRFSPAAIGGHVVQQIVQVPLSF